MRAYLSGKIHETPNCPGPWLNTIDVRLKDGSMVTIDRDTTEWYLDGDKINMTWRNVYIWDGERENYNIDASLFDEAEIIGYEIEDDADEEYELVLEKFSWG